MATYKGIQGFNIQNLTADPDNASWVGSIYYNSTTGSFKAIKAGGVSIGTWASGGNLNDARSQVGGVGTQTAAICIGGNTPPETANVETYDGSSWTEVNDLNTARRLTQGMGTVYTSALAVGGYAPPGYQTIVESWNGTSWTETTDLNSAKGAGGQAGTSTAGIVFSGVPGGPQVTNEEWNGSTWTEIADLNTGRRNAGSAGTVYTAAILFGGGVPGVIANTETWNGTSWTEVNDMNTAREELAGAGTSTLALGSGGNPYPKTNVEAWDGTSWTEVNDLATARRELASQASNSQTSALVFGGSTASGGPYLGSTEEFTAADFSINTLT